MKSLVLREVCACPPAFPRGHFPATTQLVFQYFSDHTETLPVIGRFCRNFRVTRPAGNGMADDIIIIKQLRTTRDVRSIKTREKIRDQGAGPTLPPYVPLMYCSAYFLRCADGSRLEDGGMGVVGWNLKVVSGSLNHPGIPVTNCYQSTYRGVA